MTVPVDQKLQSMLRRPYERLLHTRDAAFLPLQEAEEQAVDQDEDEDGDGDGNVVMGSTSIETSVGLKAERINEQLDSSDSDSGSIRIRLDPDSNVPVPRLQHSVGPAWSPIVGVGLHGPELVSLVDIDYLAQPTYLFREHVQGVPRPPLTGVAM